jgi:transposase-like protein
MEVVRELEADDYSYEEMRRKHGIRGKMTVSRWVQKYGNGTRGKIMRMERPEEQNQNKQLQERLRRLETALADANVALALEREFLEIACRRAGIADVAGFKKKVGGKPDIKP